MVSRIINVVESSHGSVQHIKSFLIHEEQLSQDVVEYAEKEFMKIINSKFGIDESEMDIYLEEGFFEHEESGYLLSLVWSDDVL